MRDAALAIMTLGLSRFWTTTAQRRRLWSSIVIDGRPLAYVGSPVDLAVPVAFAVTGALVTIAVWLSMQGGQIQAIQVPDLRSPGRLIFTLPLLILLGNARYRARNFVLRRTVYAGGPLHMKGRAIFYGLRHFVATLITAPSLGWALPARTVMLHRHLVTHTEIAGQTMTFTPKLGHLYRRFAPFWFGLWGIYLGTIVTLTIVAGEKIVAAQKALTAPAFAASEWGMVIAIAATGLGAFAWLTALYQADVSAHLWRATAWNGAHFDLRLTRRAHAVLLLQTVGISVLSFGLLTNWAEGRFMRRITEALAVLPSPASAASVELTEAQPIALRMAAATA